MDDPPRPDGGAEPAVLFVAAVLEGRRCLEALLKRGEKFAGFVSLDPALAPSTSGWAPFDDLAAEHGVPLIAVRDLNAPENVARVAELRPDLILVVGWTRLLGPALLRMPRLGVVGFHASLLPRYRGRAPVNWALINGERETGNTMFFLDEGVDTGAVIAQRRIPITDGDDCSTLYEKVADSAVDMLVEHLPQLRSGTAPRVPQDHRRATVMPRRRPADGVIDWNHGTRALFDWVRALTHPYPGAFTFHGDRQLFVWRAGEADARHRPVGSAPGTLLTGPAGDALVVTGDGVLRLDRVQWAGADEEPAGALAPLAGTVLGGGPS